MTKQHIAFKYIRQHSSFSAVATHYGLPLTGSGDQRTVLCPFHKETKPSCKVHLGKKVFNCFGCGAHGNILDFVMQLERTNLGEAALKLAEICGIDAAPPTGQALRSPKLSAERSKAAKAPEGAGLPEKPDSEACAASEEITANRPLSFTLKLDPRHPYLNARGVSPETIAAFGIGYCGRGLMKGRIAIPIHNGNGELVAYAGRWAEVQPPDDVARYLLPEGFRKHLELFNLHRLPEPIEHVTLVESYWSVFRLHARAVPAVSAMGRTIAPEQVELLRRRGVNRVCVLFDGDEPGRTGAATVAAELVRSFYVHTPEVPDGFKPHSADDALLSELLRH